MTNRSHQERTTPTTDTSENSQIRLGLISAVIAYTLWGAMPLYIRQVDHVSPWELVAHRVLWAIAFGAILITARSQWADVRAAFSNKRLLKMLTLSALMISMNWAIYIWALMNERTLDASLGYYINPLMYVAVGVIVLGERLRPLQILAILIATLAVIVLSIGLKALPWVSIVLAALFTVYGYIRKTVQVGAMAGLFVETVLLSPLAAGYLFWLGMSGNLFFLNHNLQTDLLLLLAGPVTVLPLLFFAISTRRLQLVTIGILQYIGPTLQLAFALHYGESFTQTHMLSFGLVWLALIIFTFDSWRASRK